MSGSHKRDVLRLVVLPEAKVLCVTAKVLTDKIRSRKSTLLFRFEVRLFRFALVIKVTSRSRMADPSEANLLFSLSLPVSGVIGRKARSMAKQFVERVTESSSRRCPLEGIRAIESELSHLSIIK